VETGEHGKAGTPLRNSLWNLLFRVVSSTDFSRIAWTTVLRGACLSFFKEPIDELPLSDNDASRLALKDRFFDLPDHRVYDLFEFLLTDQHAWGGIEAILRRAHALSGLPADGVESPVGTEPVDPGEAHFLVVFLSSLIVYLLRGKNEISG